MYPVGHPYDVLTAMELGTIHQGALRILREMGMEIQNESLLKACEAAGYSIDHTAQRVRFPTPVVERFIADADKFDWPQHKPSVTATAGVYHSLYLDPETGQFLPWTEERLAAYFALAKALPYLQGAVMLGSRLPGPAALEPLYERYYCWKYGATEGGSIDLDEVCPYLLELYQAMADYRGLLLKDVFHATVYLVPPMKLGRHEAYQVAYMRERGLRVGIGDMYAMGANAPVTMAGAVALNLAEQLALRMLEAAFFDDKQLHFGGSLEPLDMRTMVYPYGRPETAVTTLMMAQLARYYGASFAGHGGLTMAKVPSAEAGYQKALTALPILLAGGRFGMDAGLLSGDEVCSPIQLILDDEFLGALAYLTREFEISDETLAIETILEAGPGGGYVDKVHTARHFRTELWQPALWTRRMLAPWLDEGGRSDVDVARERALEIGRKGALAGLPDGLDQDLLKVIRSAEKDLLA